MEKKFKELQQKLQSLNQPQQPSDSHKLKARSLQQGLVRLQARLEQDNLLHDHKLNNMLDSLRRLQHSLKDTHNQLDIEESTSQSKMGKLQKTIRKSLDRLSKQRKQADKKIQSSLETHLIELTSFKGKASNSCVASIRQLKDIEKDVDALEREVKREGQLSKDILKKLFSQFSTQVEEIGGSLLGEERSRQLQQQKLLDTVEKTYGSLGRGIQEGRKQRERQQKQVVDLLQKVIEKIKHQLLSQ